MLRINLIKQLLIKIQKEISNEVMDFSDEIDELFTTRYDKETELKYLEIQLNKLVKIAKRKDVKSNWYCLYLNDNQQDLIHNLSYYNKELLLNDFILSNLIDNE